MAVNIEPSQDDSARKLLRQRGYTFLGLQASDPNWSDTYGVHEAPTNFLLDGQGRLVLHLSFDTAEERATSEREIAALLSQQSGVAPAKAK